VQKSLKASGHMLVQIFPALIVIILLMALMNYFVNPKTVSKYVGKGSGITGWFLAVFSGILRARSKITLHFDAPIHPAWLRCSSVK